MAEKDTEQLEHELKESESVEEFWERNREELRPFTLAEYLEHLLAEKGLSKAEVVRKSELDTVYGYHIFGGRKKNPAREKVLALALAMGLTVPETQRLLHYARVGSLYAREPWDNVILFALEHHKSVDETNRLLEDLHAGALLR